MRKKYVIFFCFLVFLDQLLKYCSGLYFQFTGGTKENIALINNWLSLSVSRENKIMGLFSFGDIAVFVLVVIYLVIIIAVFVKYKEVLHRNPRLLVAIIFLLAGITSNLIDRIIFGYVRDYVNIADIIIFNLADAMIMLSVLYLIYVAIFKKNLIKI